MAIKVHVSPPFGLTTEIEADETGFAIPAIVNGLSLMSVISV